MYISKGISRFEIFGESFFIIINEVKEKQQTMRENLIIF